MKIIQVIENFLRTSVRFRILAAISIILLTTAGFSIWSLSRLYKIVDGNNPDNPVLGDVIPNTWLTDFFNKTENQQNFPETAEFVLRFDSLKLYIKPGTPINEQINQLNTEESSQIEKTVLALSETDDFSLSDFVIKNNGTLTGTHHLRTFRNISELLCHYMLLQKRRNPEFNIVPFVKVLTKALLLMEQNDRLLISKMITTAIQKKLLNTLHTIYLENGLQAQEATDLAAVLNRILKGSLSFKQIMWSEYLLFERVLLRMSQYSPLTFWALESIFGEPLKPYRSLIENDFKITPDEFLKKNNHILLQIAVPNFTKARQKIVELEMAYMITFRQLSTLTEPGAIKQTGTDKVVLLPEKIAESDKTSYFIRYGAGDSGQSTEYRLEVQP
jgi:hypothetical protein